MNYKDIAKETIKIDEGLMLSLYKCSAGKTSIGYGRNLDDVGISKKEAEFLLQNDIDKVIAQLKEHLSECFDSLSENRKAVLVNMAFNLGIYGLLKFKKMVKALKVMDYEEAGKQMMDSRWAKQVGKRATRLRDMMING